MNTRKHFAAAVAVAGIFSTGVVTGRWSAATPGASSGSVNPSTTTAVAPVSTLEQRWSSATMEEYRRRLQLTPAQVEGIRPLLKETSGMMAQMRRDLKTNIHASIRSMNARVSTLLTVEQRREFVALIREKQAEREETPGK